MAADRRRPSRPSAPPATTPPARPGPGTSTDRLPERPFGVHFRLRGWRAVVVLAATPVTLLLVQVLVFQPVYLVEGPPDPLAPALTPLTVVATGVSTAVTAALLTLVVARMAKIPWRTVLRRDRSFDWARVCIYAPASAVLVGLSSLLTYLVAPESTGWSDPAVGTTTLLLIAVTIAFIPLQAAGEEIAFRGVVAPAAGSWFRTPGVAVAAAVMASWLLFAAVHGSLDPWFIAYMLTFSACTVVMGTVSGGLEAAIAFHVANNVLLGVVGALLAGNDSTVVDRAAGSGPGPALVILMVMNLSVTAVVWALERTRRPSAAATGTDGGRARPDPPPSH